MKYYTNYSYSNVEHEAYVYHKEKYGKHTFRISSYEEYKRLFPIMKMFPSKVIIVEGHKTLEDFKRMHRNEKYRKKYKKKVKDEVDEVWQYDSIYSRYKKGNTLNTVKTNNLIVKKDLRKLDLMYGRKI